MERIDALYICMVFLLVSTGFLHLNKFLFLICSFPCFFSDYFKNKSFHSVHNSVADLTFCFTKKTEATKHELNFLAPHLHT